MNKQSTGTVSVDLPASEFVDRYLISVLKLNKFRQAGKTDTAQLQKWIDLHVKDYQRIIDYSPNILAADRKLAVVHEKLWELEDLVRSPQAREIDYFAATAKQIFDLNTERHQLKHAIDLELPSMAFGPRLYDKGSE